MAAIPSYRAEMVGLSERDRTLLRSLLAASQARTGIRWDGGASHPPVYFIDTDGQSGAEFWQSLAEDARRDAAIVVSSAPPSEPVRWLPKPLRSTSLLSVLDEMSVPLRAPSAASPAPTTGPARVRKPNEPLRLLDVLDEAPGPGARVVQSSHWPDLVLGGGNAHAMRTAPIDAYVEGFAASTEVTRVAKYTGGPLDDDLRSDVDSLRWLVMLHAPIAEIEARLPNPARMRLRALPAFGHLPHTLQHVRMAAWLVQHPATPQDLADMIDTDEDSVLRFLGACAMLDLIQEVIDPAPAAAAVSAHAVAPAVVEQPVAEAQSDPVVEEAAAPINGDEAAAEQADEPEPSGTVSVLERLRAAREQNRARVAAAIRDISGG
jgi:hypothetical protein